MVPITKIIKNNLIGYFCDGFQSCVTDPKPERACHEQGERDRKVTGGPNPFAVQYIGMTCDKK